MSNNTLRNNSNINLKSIELFSDYSDELLTFATIACIVFVIVGVPGNILTIIALSRGKQNRNSTAAFIINLSASDLLFGCFNLPMAASTFFKRSWTLGDLLCRLFPLLRYGLLAVSLFTVSLITINRYIIIAHPRQYPRIYQRRYLAMMIAGTWILSFSIMIPTWRGVWGIFGLDVELGSCSILHDDNGRSPKEVLFLAAFLLPCLCIAFCYARIFCLVRQAAIRSREQPTTPVTKNVTTLQIDNEQQARQKQTNICNMSYTNNNGNKQNKTKTTGTPASSSTSPPSSPTLLPIAMREQLDRPFDINEDIEFIDVSETNSRDYDPEEKSSISNTNTMTTVTTNADNIVVQNTTPKNNVDATNENSNPNAKPGTRGNPIKTSLKTSFSRFNQKKSHYVSIGNTSNASSIYPGRMSVKDRRLLKMILVIFITFLICYLPITITKIWKSATEMHIVNISGYLLIYLTTCINPIIYVLMSSEYRQAYRNILSCNSDLKKCDFNRKVKS